MKTFSVLGKGMHYRDSLVYNFFDYMKRGVNYQRRYKIASEYLRDVSSVLDVCAGTGRLKRFLPRNCRYTALDASREFIAQIKREGTAHICWDLHRGMPDVAFKVDAAVMIISLYHFRKTSVNNLLEDLKGMGSRVIIVEEISPQQRKGHSLADRVMSYFCSADFFVPAALFTSDEFRDVMQRHQYNFIRYDERYCVGYYRH